MCPAEGPTGLTTVFMNRTEVRLDEKRVSPTIIDFDDSSQIPNAVYIRYRDHVFFRNVEAPAAQAILREALGWVKEENDEVMLIECDRALPVCRSGFNGVVVIKSCIVSMVSLNFEHVLNCQQSLLKNRVCAPSQRSEKLTPKNKRKGKN